MTLNEDMCEAAVITFTNCDVVQKYALTLPRLRSATAFPYTDDPGYRRDVELLQDTQNNLHPHF